MAIYLAFFSLLPILLTGNMAFLCLTIYEQLLSYSSTYGRRILVYEECLMDCFCIGVKLVYIVKYNLHSGLPLVLEIGSRIATH